MKMLKRGGYISIMNEKVWVDYKYERVSHVCQWCGCLDHFSVQCRVLDEETRMNTDPGFGEWLIYRPPPRTKKTPKPPTTNQKPKSPKIPNTNQQAGEGEETNTTTGMDIENSNPFPADSQNPPNHTVFTNPLAEPPDPVLNVAPATIATKPPNPKLPGTDKGKEVNSGSSQTHEAIIQSQKAKEALAKRKLQDLAISPNPKDNKQQDRRLSTTRTGAKQQEHGIGVAIRDIEARGALNPNASMAATANKQSRQA